MWEILTSFDPAVLSVFIAAGLVLNITLAADFLFVLVLGFAAGLFANALRSKVKILNKISAIMFGGSLPNILSIRERIHV